MTSDQKTAKKQVDLEERTQKFGEAVIEFAKSLPKTVITVPLIKQLVKAATSVGANYCEANDALSKREFAHRLAICRRESKESKHWLRMVVKAVPQEAIRRKATALWEEAQELNLIFSSILRKLEVKSKSKK